MVLAFFSWRENVKSLLRIQATSLHKGDEVESISKSFPLPANSQRRTEA